MDVPVPAPQQSDHDPVQAPHPAHHSSQQADHPEYADDRTTRTSRILFFVMLAVIVGTIAIFLILHPRPPG
jgi:hypothetical protein